MSKKKTKQLKSWLKKHTEDNFVNLAQKDGFRSRAAYKLLEIDKQDKLLNDARQVVDLGCAPGSWSQVVLNKKSGLVTLIGIDLLAIKPLPGLQFIQNDFTLKAGRQELLAKLNNKTIDLILADMSPNLTGIKIVDQANSFNLIESVLDFAVSHLKESGNALVKAFQGEELKKALDKAEEILEQVVIRKPQASRSKSNEIYLLCKKKRAV